MKLFYSILLLSFATLASASSVKVSSFGYNNTDCTDFVRQAFNADIDTIVFDLQSNFWNIRSSQFFDLKNKTILFEEGVIVAAVKDSFNDKFAELFKFVRCKNISLIGYGAEFRMNKAEYIALNDSEYRHGIAIENCVDFIVQGLIIRDTGGDGIYVGGANYWQDSLTYSKNIRIEDVQCINNYRQGLSITSVENMQVINCHFSKTKGTLPEAGVDVEPFETYQRIVNLKFISCKFFENNWSGLAIALVYMDSTSLPVSIEVNDCLFKDNGSDGHPYGNAEIYLNTDYKSPVKGKVQFNRCAIDGSDWSAFYTRKTEASYKLIFKDCVFNNVSRKQIQYNEPIFLEVPSYDNPSPFIGGIEFDNVLISYPTDFPFLRVYGWSTLAGIKNITGDLTIVANSTIDVKFENVPDTINYDLRYKKFDKLDKVPLSFASVGSTIQECKDDRAEVKVQMAKLLDYPLLVNLKIDGDAKTAEDYNLTTDAMIIEKGQLTNTLELKARNDHKIENKETILINVADNAYCYKLTDDILAYNIIDCEIINNIEDISQSKIISIAPIPAFDYIEFNTKSNFNAVIIYYENGCKVNEIKGFESNNLKIAIDKWPSGIYFAKLIFDNGSVQVKKFIKL